MSRQNKNSFSTSFVINNISEREKKKITGMDFVPFGSGPSGLSSRSRGIPYYASRGDATGLNFTRKQTIEYFQTGSPDIYYDFQTEDGATVKNEGGLGSIANASLARYGTSGYASAGYTTSNVCSGSKSLTLNVVPAEGSDTNDAYVYLPPGFEGGYSPSFGASGNSWTVSMWFKTTLASIQNLWSVMLPGSSENTSCGLYLLADHSFVLDGNGYSQTANQLTGTAVSTIRDGNWHHCAVTYDGNVSAGSRARIYVDGTDITYADTLNVGQYGTNNDSFLIGRGLHRSAKHFSGSVGEFAFWGKVFSAGSISKMYNSGNPGSRKGLSTDLLDSKKLVYD